MPNAFRLVHHANGTTTWEDVTVDVTEAEPCLIQTLCSGLSRGTERLVARGMVPRELHDCMAVPGQVGSFDFPIAYGYSLVGRVVEGPPAWRDALVHVLRPHATLVTAHPRELVRLDAGLAPAVGTMISNVETALNAVWDASVQPGDRLAIVGGGGLGALLAMLSQRIPGTDVLVIDPNEAVREFGRSLGWRVHAGGVTETEPFDVVFHTSATAAGLSEALRLAPEDTSVIDLSWYGSEPVAAALGGLAHPRRVGIRLSQVGQLPLARRARWDFLRRRTKAAELVSSDPTWAQLLTDPVDWREAPAWFARLRQASGSAILPPGVSFLNNFVS